MTARPEINAAYSPRSLAWMLGICLTLISPHAVTAQDETEQRLQQIRRDINTIKQDLGSDKKQQQQYQQELRSLEQDIAKFSRQQRQTQFALNKQQQRQHQLDEEIIQLRRKLKQLQRQLSQQFRANHNNGQQPVLKILLNQTNPGDAGRNLGYYNYFTRAQLDIMQQTKLGIEQLNLAEAQLQTHHDQLKVLQSDYNKQKQARLKRQQKRNLLLSSLNSEISNKENALNRLLEDEKSLSTLLKNLSPYDTDELNFSDLGKLKGKLKLPTQGKITNHYGSTRNQGRLKWHGITISAAEGQDIKAIAPGMVVFADWIRGYGLMLIVDHGQGYMSLYGHNQSLYKDVGEKVAANEVVAALGDSGGNSEARLYFEMRHQGKPVNPETWCR